MKNKQIILGLLGALITILIILVGYMNNTQKSKACIIGMNSTSVEVIPTEAESAINPEPTGTVTVECSSEYVSIPAVIDDYTTALYESGFRYYEIPKEYTKGDFPEIVQSYLWSQCKERGLDYYIVVALIERESGYNPNITGDSGDSKGYMQIQEKWHKWRMDAEGVTDLYSPYGNIKVGLHLLSDLYIKYGDWSKVLMCYNMGQSGAKRYWDKGIYSSAYSRGILERAQEIKQVLQD